jgi:hypothetical protein
VHFVLHVINNRLFDLFLKNILFRASPQGPAVSIYNVTLSLFDHLMSDLEAVWVKAKNKLPELQVPPQDSIKIEVNRLPIPGIFLTFPITIPIIYIIILPPNGHPYF